MNTHEDYFLFPDSTGTSRRVGITPTGWIIKLSDYDAELLGAKWCPLPLTPVCTVRDAREFVATMVR